MSDGELLKAVIEIVADFPTEGVCDDLREYDDEWCEKNCKLKTDADGECIKRLAEVYIEKGWVEK